MEASQICIAISIVIMAIIAVLVFFVQGRKKSKKITPLAGLAFGFVIAGVIFGDDRLIGYGLLSVGVILSVIDIIMKFRGNRKEI